MSFERRCVLDGTTLQERAQHPGEIRLWCPSCGAEAKYTVADVKRPLDWWAVWDLDKDRRAAVVIGDCTLWEAGYDTKRQGEPCAFVPVKHLYVGGEFSQATGPGGTVIVGRQGPGRSPRRVVVILDGENVGREVSLDPATPVFRLHGLSPHIRSRINPKQGYSRRRAS